MLICLFTHHLCLFSIVVASVVERRIWETNRPDRVSLELEGIQEPYDCHVKCRSTIVAGVSFDHAAVHSDGVVLLAHVVVLGVFIGTSSKPQLKTGRQQNNFKVYLLMPFPE